MDIQLHFVDGKVVEASGYGFAALPEHGRLIDADAFIEKVKKDRTHSCYIQSWTADDVLDVLNRNYAPTIIEADKAESEE